MGPTAVAAAMVVAPRARGPRPFLLLLVLLVLLPGAGRGNEGGAAGSCQCRRVPTRPQFVERLEACDTCGPFARFTFPNRRVCGLQEEAWVVQLKESHCPKGRPEEGVGGTEASRGHRLPAPSSPQSTVHAPTPPSSAAPRLDQSPELPGAAESHTEVAGSPPEPSAEAAAREAEQAPLEEKKAPDAKTPSVIVVCVTLAAGSVGLAYCWRRRRCSRRQAGRRPQTPLRDGEEGSLCLPGEKT